MSCFKINRQKGFSILQDYSFITPQEEAYFRQLQDKKCAAKNLKDLLKTSICDAKKKSKQQKY